jgi:hypothetical protein
MISWRMQITPIQYFDDSAEYPSPEGASGIPLSDALQIFSELADRTDIAFGYSDDGCYARAHMMCEAAVEKGMKPFKIWAFRDKAYLYVRKLTEYILMGLPCHIGSPGHVS